MIIGIDISQVVYGTGVSVYTRNLVQELLKIDKENHYVLFAGVLRRKSDMDSFIKSLSGNFRYVALPIPPKAANILWNELRIIPLEVFTGHLDVLHTSDWGEPRSRAVKISTVHDLAPILLPKETSTTIVNVHKKKLSLVKKETSCIISPSATTRDDLVALGFSPDRIRVISEAPDPAVILSKTSESPTYGRYILAVGTSPRKNLERVTAAFLSVKDQLKLDHLVIVGQAPKGNTDGVTYTGFISNDELSSLYRHAQALVYVSLYEGFGLPILEAFALGCPVVTSDVGSMKELGADAAVLVNPLSESSIQEGLKKVIRKRDLYIKAGKVRVKRYSWHKAAEDTLAVYKEVYAKTK